jgi:hypothetical protein
MEKSDGKSPEKMPLAGIDVVTSLVVMAFSAAVAAIALGLPVPVGWNSAPALIPLIFAGSLFMMGLGLLVSAWRRGGFPTLGRALAGFSLRDSFADRGTKRSIWIIVLAAIYTLLLTGRVPFEISASLFLFSCFTIFWRKGGWLKIVLISLLVPLSFSLAFKFLFAMLLPGDSILDLWF